jgi:hypothetical protein
MLHLLYVLLATARSSLKLQRELALENLALRQQLAIVHRKHQAPRAGSDVDWHGPRRALPARSNANALAFARAEIVSDQIVTRAQGKQGDSRVLQGT